MQVNAVSTLNIPYCVLRWRWETKTQHLPDGLIWGAQRCTAQIVHCNVRPLLTSTDPQVVILYGLMKSHAIRLSCLGCESSLHPVYPVCVCHPPTASQWPSHLTNRLLLFHNIYTQVTPQKIYLKFDELFLFGNLQILIFLDSSWLSVVKIVESELADKKRQVYFL